MPSASGCSRPNGPDAGGSPAILNAAQHLALEQHRIGDRRQRNDEDDDDLKDAEQQECLKFGQVDSFLAFSSKVQALRF